MLTTDSINVQKNEKSIILMATPRSGSYLAYSILEKFFECTRNVEGLGEYLVLWSPKVNVAPAWLNPKPKFKYQNLKDPRRSLPKLGRKKTAAVTNEKLDALMNFSGRYLFKTHPHQFSAVNLKRGIEQFEWIFAERRNLFEQMLSFLISTATDKFYLKGGLIVADRSIGFEELNFNTLADEIYHYFLIKLVVPKKRTLVYEDILQFGIKESLLKSEIADRWPMGLNDKDFKVPDQQNGQYKLKKMRQPQRVIDCYRNSFLNDRFPIDRNGLPILSAAVKPLI